MDFIPVNISLNSEFSLDDDILNKIAYSIDLTSKETNSDKYYSYLKIPEEDGSYYRVSTIQNGNSFLHCILKMINREYNTYDFKKRIKMAKKFRNELIKVSDDEKLNTNIELSDKHYGSLLCEILKININIYDINDDNLILIKAYNYPRKPYKKQTFCLLKNKHRIYEPIGFLSDEGNFYFNFSSEKKQL